MQTFYAAFLFAELQYLSRLPLGYSDSNTNDSDTFRVEDYPHWLEHHQIELVNYAVEVGKHAHILSPITPAPLTIRWFSLALGGELPHLGDKVSVANSLYFKKFRKTYNTTWHDVFKYDEIIRLVKVLKVRLAYADVFRVLVEEKIKDDGVRTDVHPFDVAITLMIFEKHKCRFTSRPQNPKKGDSLILTCGVIINGYWNTSLIFRNEFDESEIIGDTSQCGKQPRVGTKICSTVNVTAEALTLAYSCRLKFSPSERHDANTSLFQNSTWTANFNKEIICTFPKIHLEAIPSDVAFLCNQMPCGDTVSVDDTVTCMAQGYPQPDFDLRIKKLSSEPTSEVDHEDGFFLDAADESSEVEIKNSKDHLIMQKDVGQVKLTCNVSNELGWGYNSLVLEVVGEHTENSSTDAGEIVVESPKGIAILCNGKICKNYQVMRIEDEISCAYDPRRFASNISLTLKLKGVVKAVQKPWLYSLQFEDVGEKLVQCVGQTDAGMYESEITIAVSYAHRNPHESGIHIEEQPKIVILCNEHECRDNETVNMPHNITCMTDSLENETIQMKLNGVTVGVAMNNFTHRIVNTSTNGTVLLLVACNISSDANDTVSVQLHVANVTVGAAAGGMLVINYDEEDFLSSEFEGYDDAKQKFRDDRNYDDYFSEFEHDTVNSTTDGPKSVTLLDLFVVFFAICMAKI